MVKFKSKVIRLNDHFLFLLYRVRWLLKDNLKESVYETICVSDRLLLEYILKDYYCLLLDKGYIVKFDSEEWPDEFEALVN